MTRRLVDEARRVRERIDGEQATAAEAVRLRQAVAARVSERHRSPWLLLVPAGAAAVAVLALMLWPEPGWFDIVSGEACVSRQEADISIGADCGERVRLRVLTAEIDARAGAELRRDEDAVRLVRGGISVRLEPRAAGEPFRVRVSHGTIEARGTLFSVEQRDNEGRVDLVSGVISFTWADGSGSDLLAPGQSLLWPRQEPRPSDAPAEPPPRRKTVPVPLPSDEAEAASPGEPIGDVLRRLSQLGSQGRHAESAALLRQAIARPDFTSEQKERLSYELGVVLAEELDEPIAACAHWRAHHETYPSGARSDRVRERLRECP